MKYIFKVAFLIFISVQALAQNAQSYSLCGKTGDCTMTWDEFIKCRKELIPADKNASVSSFTFTIKQAERKKDSVFTEFPEKGNMLSKSSFETIEKLHAAKRLGNKLLISNVEVVQSGKAARKLPGMVITLIN